MDIINLITNSSHSFDELHKKLKLKKFELAQELKVLQENGLIIKLNDTFHYAPSLKDIEGYTCFSPNGACWISPIDTTNDFGLSFDNTGQNVLNKKIVRMGDYCFGKVIPVTKEDGSITNSVYITSSVNKKTPDLVLFKNNNKYQIVNNGLYDFITSEALVLKEREYENNTFYLAKNIAGSYKIEKIGALTDVGIETKLTKLLGNVEEFKGNYKIQPKPVLPSFEKDFLTIDSITTKDIDDAICVEKTEKGFSLYIAIANPTLFIEKNSELDIFSKEKSTSFYFPHFTSHLLPRELSENSFSLNLGQKRASMICQIDFDIDGNMKSNSFFEKEVATNYRLTYNDVDAFLKNEKMHESSVVDNGIKNIGDIGEDKKQNLKTQLEYIQFLMEKNPKKEQSEVYENIEFSLNSNGKIENLYIETENGISQKIVEFCMLKANMAAAETILNSEGNGLFRNQLKPPEKQMPKPANYEQNNYGHYGLGAEFYTHFSSPIRRYCDMVVHRSLRNKDAYSVNELNELSKIINIQQYKSKQLTIKVKNLLMEEYKMRLIHNKTLDNAFNIVDIKEHGLMVRNSQLIEAYIPKFIINSPVFDFEKEFKAFSQNAEYLNVIKDNFSVNLAWNNYEYGAENKEKSFDFKKKQPKLKI